MCQYSTVIATTDLTHNEYDAVPLSHIPQTAAISSSMYSKFPSTPRNVIDEFNRLMTDRSLEPNHAQMELIMKLQSLQNGVVRCDVNGILHRRLMEGRRELEEQLVVQHRSAQGDGFIESLSGLLSWWTTSKSTPINGSDITKPEETKMLELSKTPYEDQPDLKSFYIWGGVGQGKTMLMDAFYHSTPIKRKTRAHFHDFMLDVQQQLHQLHMEKQPQTDNSHFRSLQIRSILKPQDPKRRSSKLSKEWDPILQVAHELASNYRLLCLDEFQVVHIADAMILKPLFEGLFHFGCVVIATSNRPPSDLYRGGLNRERFIPFIQLLENHWEIFNIRTNKDYRQHKVSLSPETFRLPSTSSTLLHENSRPLYPTFNYPVRSFDDTLRHMKFINQKDESPEPGQVEVMMGRMLKVPYKLNQICLFRFNDLCGRAVGAADYIALAHRYHTIFLYDIPGLGNFDENPNEIRRFIQLIDVLYEKLVRVVFDSRVPLLKLFGVTSICKSVEVLRLCIQSSFPSSLDSFLEALDSECTETNHKNRIASVSRIAGVNQKVAIDVVRAVERALDRHHASSNKRTQIEMPEQQKPKLFIPFLRACLIFHAHNFDLKVEPYFSRSDTEEYSHLNFDFSTNNESANIESSGTHDNRFAFERTASRIRHMLSEDYLLRHQRQWDVQDVV